MNDLIRPALYGAWQNVIPVIKRMDQIEKIYDIVGPVCESADFLGKARSLSLEQNDFLAICDTGAYGFSMSSNYNSRPRCAEVLVKDNNSYLIRERESFSDLIAHEKILAIE